MTVGGGSVAPFGSLLLNGSMSLRPQGGSSCLNTKP